MTNKPQTGRKYLQNIYLIKGLYPKYIKELLKGLYPKYIKELLNSTMRKKEKKKKHTHIYNMGKRSEQIPHQRKYTDVK